MVPLSWSWRDALLLAGDDEAGEHRQHRAVHRHRHRHLVERDAVEEDLHVLDGVDRDAGLADVADDAGVVAVVAAVGGEVEGHRQAHLPGGEVAAVEGVRLLGGREARRTGGSSTAGSRTSWPGRRARTARTRAACRRASRPSRSAAVYSGFDGDALGRLPGQLRDVAAGFFLGEGAPLLERLAGKLAVSHEPQATCALVAASVPERGGVSWPCAAEPRGRGSGLGRGRRGPERRPPVRRGGPGRRAASRASEPHGGHGESARPGGRGSVWPVCRP